MQDPFPETQGKAFKGPIPKNIADMVYSTSRYKSDQSPKCIYFPSRYIMFKMMRACVDVTKKEDLWYGIFYQNYTDERLQISNKSECHSSETVSHYDYDDYRPTKKQ